MKFLLRIAVLLLIFSSVLNAAAADKDSLEAEEKETIVLPFGFYTSETGVALGLFSQIRFNKNDMIFGNIIYTFKNQLMFFLVTDRNFGRYIFYNKLKVEDYYSEIFGTGTGSEPEDKYDYRYFFIDSRTDLGRNVLHNTGLYLSADNFYYRPDDKKDSLAYLYSRNDGHFSNGLGLSLKYSDVTDRFYRDGSSAQISIIHYPGQFGNIKEFTVIETDAAYFRSIKESSLSLNGLTRFAFGSPHPQKLSSIGGSSVLRGFPEKRFLDRGMWAIQMQYDIRIYKKISLSAFVSSGSVFGGFSDISFKDIKTGYGSGIMYDFKGLAVRIEAATSNEKDIQFIATGSRTF